MQSPRVRPPSVAGTWYPGEPETLAHEVDRLMEGASGEAAPGETPIALIAPHAGYRYSGACAGRAYRLLRGARVERVVVMGPSHHARFEGAALPEEDVFATPLGEIPLDRDACEALLDEPLVKRRPEAHAREHAIEIQLPFLQRACGSFRLVPLLVGQLEGDAIDRLAGCLRSLQTAGTLLVVSSDFTHYGASFGYLPFLEDVPERLRALDRGAIDLILALDADGLESYHGETGITACGLRPILAVMRALPRNTRAELVEYTTSGDVSGDWDHVVSYAAIAFRRDERALHLDAAARRYLLRSARGAIESALELETDARETGPPPGTELVPGGVFVTLHGGDALRGCIGCMEPDRKLVDVVREQAVRSSFHDPRFPPLDPGELEGLRIEISVLDAPWPVAGPESFEPGRHGIVMEKDGRRAVFLPQVAREQGWDREETLRRLSEKAGLPPDAWRSGASFWIFEAQVFGEEEGTGSGDPV